MKTQKTQKTKKDVRLTLRLPAGLHAAVRKEAALNFQSITGYILAAVSKSIGGVR